MADLHKILGTYVSDGSLPGAVGLMARGDRTEVAAVGSAGPDGTPMARDSIFRLASVTKHITAAAVMMLVDDRRIASTTRSAGGCRNWRGRRSDNSQSRRTLAADCCSARPRC